MFIRETETKNRKTGAVYIKHQLVESIRTESGPRQRVVMDLGHLDIDRSRWKSLAIAIADRLAGTQSVVEEDPEIQQVAEKALGHYDFLTSAREKRDTRKREARYVNVDVTTTTTSFNRSLGAELVAGEYYRRVGFEKIFSSLGFDAQRRSLAKAVILARLISPGSELSSHRWITRISALPEMLEIDVSTVGKDAIYETADLLYAKKHEIEAMANRIWTQKMDYKRRLLLFDITNTYFEGSCKDNHLARFGHSKEKRSDCRLVALGLVTDEMGAPVHSEIYEENRSEPSTLAGIIDSLAAVNTISAPLSIAMDRGIATKENLELLKERGYPYIVIERFDKRSTYTEQFRDAKESFTKMEKKGSGAVYVKAIPCEEGTRVLCLSEGRAAKEHSMDEARRARFLEALSKLKGRIEAGRLRNEFKVANALGRITSKYPSIAKHYEIEPLYDVTSENQTPRKLRGIEVKELESNSERASLQGCYTITTSHEDLTAEEIWNLYMTLVRVEEAFRSLKSDLGLRPVYHQNAERTAAHLFISVLAYHIMAAIEYDLRANGDTRRWSTVKETLSTHIRSTIIFTDDKDQIHHLRVSSTPEACHKEIYDTLKVKDTTKRKHRIVARL